MKFRKAISILSISALLLGSVPGVVFADISIQSVDDIKDDEEIVTPNDDAGNETSDNTDMSTEQNSDGQSGESTVSTEDNSDSQSSNSTTKDDGVVKDEEIKYSPSTASDRQTNEEIEKIPSTRTATASKQSSVREATLPSASQALSSSRRRSASSTSTASNVEQDTSNTVSTGANNVQQNATQDSAVQSPPTSTQIGQTSEAPKTGSASNSTLYAIMTVALLGIVEVFVLRKRFQ